ncbi:VOC family protein [Oceanicoccus sp. KOV_DT_Chl]|uniref:VOC family protein n=1 Tax=Oceanicoccus sp. KOV_DT_Chl TaxID=1904639 RepID=UPI000C7A3573|nr:VOC family protein [Oceanicoccus sp. KOV_DT_Chl]
MQESVKEDIFGAVRLGYILVGSRKLPEWKQFAKDGIGLQLAFESTDQLAFRLDNHARRLIIQEDDAEDIIATGWQLDNDMILEIVLKRLSNRNVPVEYIDDERAELRGVTAFHQFIGPKGLMIDLFTQPEEAESPLDMLNGGFITGEAGLGHVSIMSREPERNIEFWQEIFDARVSDNIDMSVGNREVIGVTFLRMNPRHHSVAIAATKGLPLDMYRTRIQHLNFEVAKLDDLSSAYERCKALNCKFTRNIGQHPNDKELSFYVTTPSGFEFELGWDALVVNESSWEEGLTYPNMSTWGHEIPGRFSSELGLNHLVQIIKSFTKNEYLPW